MFNTQTEPEPNVIVAATAVPAVKYNNMYHNTNSTYSDESNYSMIDQMLEKEKQQNKTETWNKLDKTVKIQKLHAFAEKYGKEHSLPLKDVKSLKSFFIESLEKLKLQKTKDVIYDKELHVVTGIPALFFNSATHNFTLKNMDAKRVSTIKSLTPKRITEKNKSLSEAAATVATDAATVATAAATVATETLEKI